MPITGLLIRLKESNARKNARYLEQIVSIPEPIIAPKLASLVPSQYLHLSPMLEDRFRFAGKWINATLAFTWLSLSDIENAWTDPLAQEAINLRKENWPTSVLNQHQLEKIALFAIDIEEGNEVYLVFTATVEPQVVSYFGAQEDRYKNLESYITAKI